MVAVAVVCASCYSDNRIVTSLDMCGARVTSPALGELLVLHYDGTGWTEIDTGAPASVGAGWSSGPDDVYVATGPARHSSDVQLNRVSATSPTDAFIVGDVGTVLH